MTIIGLINLIGNIFQLIIVECVCVFRLSDKGENDDDESL